MKKNFYFLYAIFFLSTNFADVSVIQKLSLYHKLPTIISSRNYQKKIYSFKICRYQWSKNKKKRIYC